MEIKNNIVVLEETGCIDGYDFMNYVTFTETSGTMVRFPVRTLLRLHSILEYQVKKEGLDFETYCQGIM